MTPLDVVYPLRADGDYEELRYSLRSLRNLPHRRVWLVGGRPSWVRDVGHIPTTQMSTKVRNVYLGLIAAARHRGVSDPFILFNDDFFVTEPVDDVPVWHLGPIRDVLEGYVGRADNYVQRIHRTARVVGYDALSYEGHWPMRLVKAPLLDLLDECARDELQIRTVYGNRMRLDGEQHPDCKIKRDGFGVRTPFTSTSDTSFAEYQIGRDLRAMFPDPSPYERPPL